MKNSLVILTLCAFLGLVACDPNNPTLNGTSVNDPNSNNLPDINPTTSELGMKIMKDLYTVAVNKSLVTLGSDGTNNFLQMRSLGGTSSAGAFYGGGIGNKIFLGFGGDTFAGKLVSDFSYMQFTTRELATNPVGSYNVYLNMLVDLNCDVNNPNYVIVVSDQTTTPGPKGNWYTFMINADDSVFKSVGGIGGLPNNNGSTYAPLSALSSAYPLACFVAADVFDNGMKRDQKLSPFLLVHGDSGYSLASAVQVDQIEIKVGAQTLDFGF